MSIYDENNAEGKRRWILRTAYDNDYTVEELEAEVLYSIQKENDPHELAEWSEVYFDLYAYSQAATETYLKAVQLAQAKLSQFPDSEQY